MQPKVNLVEVQKQIDWLRTTTPENIVEQGVGRLRAGVDENVLWAACALTSSRYINNQAHNMLGFVSHAMIGCEDARHLAATQTTRTRHLLLLQSLYMVAFDLHDPCLSPFEMLPCKGWREKSVEENIRMLRMDIRIGEYLRCDHRFVTLEQDMPRAELIDLLLHIGLEGMTTDDHTMITPVLSLGMMELVGWERGFEMLRCAIRYTSSFPRDFASYDRAVALWKQYGLENGATSTDLQLDRIPTLRQAFRDAQPHERPEIAARALSQQGYSPVTVISAASMTACDFYLMVEPVPHEDFDAVSREVAPIHIGNCISALRRGIQWMQPGTQALAAIRAGSLLERGPSVLSPDFEFVPFVPARAYPYAEDVEALAGSKPETLLEILRESISSHNYRTVTAAVRVYAQSGASPEPLIALLTEFACTDSGTLLHNFKHLNSMVKEFWLSQQKDDRWNYLMQAARFITWYAGLTTSVYERAVQSLDPIPA
jgi:hypothetical protein